MDERPVVVLNVSRKRYRDDEGNNEGGDPRFESFTIEDADSCERSCKDWGLSDFLQNNNPDADAGFTGENFEEDMISDVMKSLEQEIQCEYPLSLEDRVVCFTENSCPVSSDYADENSGSGLSVSDSASSVTGSANVDDSVNGCHDISIEYLLEATDDELGIPPSPHTLQIVSSGIFDSSVGNIFDNYPEAGEEQLLELCWYGNAEEQEAFELFSDIGCQDWTVRPHLNGELFEGPYL